MTGSRDHPPRTVPALVDWAASRHGGTAAVIDAGGDLTFEELAGSAAVVARALMAFGIDRHDRVAIWHPNSHLFVRWMLGTGMAGATLVPINTRYRSPEALDLLARTQPKAIVIDSSFLGYDYLAALVEVDSGDEVAAAARRNLRVIVDTAASAVSCTGGASGPPILAWHDFVAAAEDTPLEPAARRAAAVEPEDLLEIIFTSGTTGRAKGVTLAHGPCLDLYRTYGDIWGLRPGDRYLVSLPMFHAGGANAGVLTCVLHGVTNVPMATFDVVRMMEIIDRERITVLNGPPTVLSALLDHPDRGRYDLASLRTVATGATNVPVAMVERVMEELPFDYVITAYGLTECYGTATMCRPDDSPTVVATTNGRALPGVELRIVDDTGADVGPGGPGEILVRSAAITPGYWEEPEETRTAIRDGWLHTGDIGSLDEMGNLRITDRLKDILVVGGFNVSPTEVEQALLHHPGVAEVSVVGVPDERLGEVARAFVVRHGGSEVTEAEIVGWCRTRMANFKVPRSVVFMAELPRTASGKVVKFELRRAAIADRQ